MDKKVADIANKLKPIFETHQVVLAYLFGSAARGQMGPRSDIDVAVSFDDKVVPPEKQPDVKLHLSLEIARACDVHEVDVINLNQVTDPVIRYESVLAGEPIFIKDTYIQAQLASSVLREYEDTNYLREISYKILREQIKSGQFGRAPVVFKKHVAGK